jgi:hypothetical protein
MVARRGVRRSRQIGTGRQARVDQFRAGIMIGQTTSPASKSG